MVGAFFSLSVPAPGFRRAQAPSVGKGPGAMALKRTPRLPHSTARDWVITFSPALDMADGTVNGPPCQTQVVRIEQTEACLPSESQRLPHSCVTKNEPRKTMLAMASKRRGLGFWVRLMKLPGALFIGPVSAPPSAQTVSIISAMASGTRMSQAMP